MAIQIPNPGTGNGASGDNEFVLWSKVKDNFSDQTNAASKLVGATAGKIPLAGDVFTAAATLVTSLQPPSTGLMTDFPMGVKMTATSGGSYTDKPVKTSGTSDSWAYRTESMGGNAYSNFIFAYPYRDADVYFKKYNYVGGGIWSEWAMFYHTGNTTKDSNGFIKAASPIVKVFADKVELNGDAVDQNVIYKKNGIGDYTITTVSGLSTDGWYIELPKDMNGNPKVAVTLSEVDGVISLKSYKRIFSMETFTFEPDLDNPLDIPDTRWIDLRLNEIPVEPSEFETEV